MHASTAHAPHTPIPHLSGHRLNTWQNTQTARHATYTHNSLAHRPKANAKCGPSYSKQGVGCEPGPACCCGLEGKDPVANARQRVCGWCYKVNFCSQTVSRGTSCRRGRQCKPQHLHNTPNRPVWRPSFLTQSFARTNPKAGCWRVRLRSPRQT